METMVVLPRKAVVVRQFANANGVPRLLQPLARVHHLAAIHTDYTFFVGAHPGRPLATATNNEVWNGRPLATATNNEGWKAMLSPNVRFSHLHQARSLHVLHLLIRFYITKTKSF